MTSSSFLSLSTSTLSLSTTHLYLDLSPLLKVSHIGIDRSMCHLRSSCQLSKFIAQLLGLFLARHFLPTILRCNFADPHAVSPPHATDIRPSLTFSFFCHIAEPLWLILEVFICVLKREFSTVMFDSVFSGICPKLFIGCSKSFTCELDSCHAIYHRDHDLILADTRHLRCKTRWTRTRLDTC